MGFDTPTVIGILGFAAFIFGRPIIRMLGSAAAVAFFIGYIKPSRYLPLFKELGVPDTALNFLKDLHVVCAPYATWILDQVKVLLG